MEIESVLREIGFEENEVKTYLALLKQGESLASSVAEKTKINRSLVYQILDGLINKGYVSYVIKNNKRYYNSVSPEKVLEIIKEREKRFESVLSELNNFAQSQKQKPRVEILEGSEGIKTIMNEILRLGKEWLALAAGKSSYVLPYYADAFQKERAKKKILLKTIMDDSIEGKERAKFLNGLNHTEVKHLENPFINPASIWVYSDRIAIVMWDKEHAFAIRTISKEIAESYRNYFNALWIIAKK